MEIEAEEMVRLVSLNNAKGKPMTPREKWRRRFSVATRRWKMANPEPASTPLGENREFVAWVFDFGEFREKWQREHPAPALTKEEGRDWI